MRAAIDPAMLATDLADYLVDRGIPFREAHKLSGMLVREAERRGVSLSDLPFEAFRDIHSVFDEDVLDVFEVDRSPAARRVAGATAPAAVREQIALARAALA
jgi:argininosuccinate lyase